MKTRLRKFLFAVLWMASLGSLSGAAESAERTTGLWDVGRLLDAPVHSTWGKQQGCIQEVYYDCEPLAGKPTRVFAYYARPEGEGPYPAMLLVHGGGGKAFSEWAEQWTKRGYAALAMDTTGNGPTGKELADGGPKLSDDVICAFTQDNAREMWPYHAVAAILRGHALLATRPEVDKNRIGITGISWGGYLTCIVAGIDHRLKVAVPVYGCGYLAENSAWCDNGSFGKLSDDERQRWTKNFDPASYLSAVECPMLFVNGTNDFAYPLDSYQKSYRLVKSPVTLCITVNMAHSHPAGWKPEEIGAFVDSVLKQDTKPLPRLAAINTTDQKATANYDGPSPAKAELHYTSGTGKWQTRRWTTTAANVDAANHAVTANLPTERPLTLFFTVTNDRGLAVSNAHVVVEK